MDTSTWLALLSIVVAVGGVGTYVWSIQILVRQMRVQSYEAIYQHQQTLDLFMFDHLDLKLHIEQHRPLPADDPELVQRLMACAELFVTEFEHIYSQRGTMSDEVGGAWDDYMRHLCRSPTITGYLRSRPDWYPEELFRHLEVDISGPSDEHTAAALRSLDTFPTPPSSQEQEAP